MKQKHLLSTALFSIWITAVSCTADDLSDVGPGSINGQSITGSTQLIQPGVVHSGVTNRIVSSTACNAYEIALESITPVGSNFEWVWSVRNLNPGNGNGGTVQDLSHWGMQFGSCFNFSSIVGGAYSGDGVNWTSFTPNYQVDPSQSCMTTPVMKFDFGTVGAAPSYYKLVLNQNYHYVIVPGYYKSGKKTGCCVFNFPGIGCQEPPDEK
jgi:hypothetical protein